MKSIAWNMLPALTALCLVLTHAAVVTHRACNERPCPPTALIRRAGV
jgi:hypothetical protein